MTSSFSVLVKTMDSGRCRYDTLKEDDNIWKLKKLLGVDLLIVDFEDIIIIHENILLENDRTFREILKDQNHENNNEELTLYQIIRQARHRSSWTLNLYSGIESVNYDRSLLDHFFKEIEETYGIGKLEYEKFIAEKTLEKRIFRRMNREIRKCYRRKYQSFVSVIPSKSEESSELLDVFRLIATIKGPKDSVYENGVFRIQFEMSRKDYPFVPPKITFLTRMFHPMYRGNSEYSKSCSLDGFFEEDKWHPIIDINRIIGGMIHSMKEFRKISLSFKDHDGMKAEIQESADLLMERKYDVFEERARVWTRLYAMGNLNDGSDDLRERMEYLCSNVDVVSVIFSGQEILVTRILLNL